MSAPAVVPVESKSAKKRKGKAENATLASGAVTPSVEATSNDAPSTTNGVEPHSESPYIRDLQKNLRNIQKKLGASAKADAVIAENPGVPLDDLVSQKKLNADQKAQILKKPQLKEQAAQIEDQLHSFRTFAHDLEERFNKEKIEMIERHEAELATAKESAEDDLESSKAKAVEDALRVVTHFLHAAASKRQSEEADSDEGRAFEGALLLVYQGNETSLSTLKSLVYGTDEKVPDVQGEPIDFTFDRVQKSAMQSGADLAQAAEADPTKAESTEPAATEIQTDATVANAGLTELDDTTATIQAKENGIPDHDGPAAIPEQATTGDGLANAAAEAAWNPEASVVTGTSDNPDEWVQVPRDPAETETGVAATPAPVNQSTNWAEESSAAAEEKPAAENDGFEQVRRERGRGRGGRGGRGERGDFRGRGRGGRGDGFRGRGRGDGPRGGRGAPRGSDKS